MSPADVLTTYACGTLSPGLALTKLIFAAPDEASARAALRDALSCAQGSPHARLNELRKLWDDTPGAFALVTAIGGDAEPRTRSVEEWSAVFDRAVARSSAASVALYSLGRADLLATATAELVSLLETEGLLRRSARVLEIGCGIGRLAHAIATAVNAVLGVDISQGMLAQARRTVGSTKVSFVRGDGRGLAFLREDAFDLVLAVDVFPYLVATGSHTVSANLRDCARVLRRGGRLLVFNFSYRGDEHADTVELAAIATAAGMRIASIQRPFQIWDALVFDLRKTF